MRSGECSVRNRYRASDARRWSSARRRSNAAERIAATMSIAESTSLPHGFGSPETCRATNPSRRVPNRRGVSSAERTGNGSSSRFNGSDTGRRERSSAWILPSARIRSSSRARAGPGRYASLTPGSVPDSATGEKFSERSSRGLRKRQLPSAPLKARISRHTSSRSSSNARPRAQIRAIRGTAEIGKSREGNPAPFGEPPGYGIGLPIDASSGKQRWNYIALRIGSGTGTGRAREDSARRRERSRAEQRGRGVEDDHHRDAGEQAPHPPLVEKGREEFPPPERGKDRGRDPPAE